MSYQKITVIFQNKKKKSGPVSDEMHPTFSFYVHGVDLWPQNEHHV